MSGKSGSTNWVSGFAWQHDSFRSKTFPAFDYSYEVPGIFAQVEQDIGRELILAGSARLDFHNEYGTRFSPRLSALYRPGPWKIRASIGRGFFAPTPFVEEIEAAGLSRLAPLNGLQAETAETASLDIGYARGPFEANLTLFESHMHDTTGLRAIAPDLVELVNVPGLSRIRGSELLLRYRRGSFVMTGSWVFLDATEPDHQGTGRHRMPLTPRHSAGLVAMWEDHDKGRVGVELYYTGRQPLEEKR